MISFSHLLLFLFIFLLFGSKNLPKMGTMFGNAARKFREGQKSPKVPKVIEADFKKHDNK